MRAVISGAEQMLERVTQSSGVEKVMAAAGTAVSTFVPDAFFWLFLVLVLVNIADYFFGRHAARARGDFSTTKSRQGLVSKGAQLTILVVLRSLEAILPMAAGLEIRLAQVGVASTALALLLIIEDIESIERHNVDLGGRPIPGLSALTSKVRQLTGGERRRRRGPTPEGTPQRRATDPPLLPGPDSEPADQSA